MPRRQVLGNGQLDATSICHGKIILYNTFAKGLLTYNFCPAALQLDSDTGRVMSDRDLRPWVTAYKLPPFKITRRIQIILCILQLTSAIPFRVCKDNIVATGMVNYWYHVCTRTAGTVWARCLAKTSSWLPRRAPTSFLLPDYFEGEGVETGQGAHLCYSISPVIAMQSAGKNFTSAGCAVICQDDHRLLCELPRLSWEHLPGQGTCLQHAPTFIRIPEVSLVPVVIIIVTLCNRKWYC